MLDYQPDYRSLFNPSFLKQADKNNKIRREEELRRLTQAELKRQEDAQRAEQERRHAQDLAARAARIEGARREWLGRLVGEARAEVEGHEEHGIAVHRIATYADIERRICRATGVSINAIRSNRKTKELIFVRHAIVYWAVRLTKLSYPHIGRIQGGRDHSTIIHAVKSYRDKRAKEGKIRRPAR